MVLPVVEHGGALCGSLCEMAVRPPARPAVGRGRRVVQWDGKQVNL